MENLRPNELMLEASRKGITLFRNNTGVGWVGSKLIWVTKTLLKISDPRPLRAGLCTGSSDYIGFRKIKITQEHVGKTVAQFVAIEEKRGKDRMSAAQINFLRVVNEAGGYGIEARWPSDIDGEGKLE